MLLNRYALREIRERTPMTVSTLARQAGIGQAHLSNVELGRRKASDEVIAALADGLKVDVRAITYEAA